MDDMAEPLKRCLRLRQYFTVGLEIVVHVLPNLRLDIGTLPLGAVGKCPDHVDQYLC